MGILAIVVVQVMSMLFCIGIGYFLAKTKQIKLCRKELANIDIRDDQFQGKMYMLDRLSGCLSKKEEKR